MKQNNQSIKTSLFDIYLNLHLKPSQLVPYFLKTQSPKTQKLKNSKTQTI